MKEKSKDKIIDHYSNPRNYGSLKSANYIFEGSTTHCGDNIIIELFIKNKLIVDLKFRGEGCAVSIATTSIFLDEIKNMPLDEIKKIDNEMLYKILKFRPKNTKIDCATLCLETLKNGINEIDK